MNFSKQLESMVYTTPVVDFNKENLQAMKNESQETKNKQNMLNELGLAIKRR